jgi:hypothetical protein
MTPQHPFPVARLILPADGRVPCPPAVSRRENTIWQSPVSQALALVANAMPHRAPRLPDFELPSEAERERGWKRWLLSHHLFVPTMAFTGYCLERTAEAIAAGRVNNEATHWLECAAKLRRGCGALFLYGVDFEPCAAIYCGHIRSRMPPAFSGYQIRERQTAFLPGLTAFRESSCRSGAQPLHARLHDLWVESDIRYHECHQRCIMRSVSPAPCPHAAARQEAASNVPESLRAAYRRHHGKVPEIDESAFNQFDVWFGIERREGFRWTEYAGQVARIVQEIVADLEAGHRLDNDVTADLFDSMNAVLALLGHCGDNQGFAAVQGAGDPVLAGLNYY